MNYLNGLNRKILVEKSFQYKNWVSFFMESLITKRMVIFLDQHKIVLWTLKINFKVDF